MELVQSVLRGCSHHVVVSVSSLVTGERKRTPLTRGVKTTAEDTVSGAKVMELACATGSAIGGGVTDVLRSDNSAMVEVIKGSDLLSNLTQIILFGFFQSWFCSVVHFSNVFPFLLAHCLLRAK